jgi:hypothetical protein
MKWTGHVARMSEMRKAYKIWRRSVENIKMDLGEIKVWGFGLESCGLG